MPCTIWTQYGTKIPTEGTNINVSGNYIIQANSVQNVGISLSSELRALRGAASIVTTGVHDTLDVHPAVYEIQLY
jgi:ABC-type uncharacterized transport system permease subunit